MKTPIPTNPTKAPSGWAESGSWRDPLVISAISRQTFEIPRNSAFACWSHYTVARIATPQQNGGEPPIRQAGDIVGFSTKSRRRLIQTMLRVNYCDQNRPEFLTLTYPRNWPKSPQQWKNDLGNWFREAKREFPVLKFIWKLEFQKRGAPHFHIILRVTDEQRTAFDAWLNRHGRNLWHRLVGQGDRHHQKRGFYVENVHSAGGMVRYVTKYVSKETQPKGLESVGRWWGATLDWEDEAIMSMDGGSSEFFALRRLARRMHKARVRRKDKIYDHYRKCSAVHIGLDVPTVMQYLYDRALKPLLVHDLYTPTG